LFDVQNYKWLILPHLYADVYLKSGYEKDMDMGKLHIQFKVADCRGEDTTTSKKKFKILLKKYIIAITN
jgi:hypothetical protein